MNAGRSLSHPNSPTKLESSTNDSKLVRPKSSVVELEDLEPGGRAATPIKSPPPAANMAGTSMPALLDAAIDVGEDANVGATAPCSAKSLVNLRFTPLVMPGQATTDQDDDDDDAKSAGGDSFATAASTLTLNKNNLTDSPASDSLTFGSGGDFCKICHCGGEVGMPLIAPCFCSGSLKYVHQECLQRWIKSADIKRCELCKYPFSMQSKVKPFCQWEKLDMSSLERRKLLCSVTFHAVAVTCVIWSLYVLVDRTAQEIRAGQLQWPFWTKLVVVAIGFTGGLVFMYIQCKVYVHLCRKWKAYNRVIVVQDAPEGVHNARVARRRAAAAAQAAAAAAKAAEEVSEQPQQQQQQNDNQDAEAASPTTGAATASADSAASSASKTNAETQTALRGAAIVEAMMKERQWPPPTSSRMSHHTHHHLRNGSDSGVASSYFTECEISAPASAASNSIPSNNGNNVTKSASPSMDCLRKIDSASSATRVPPRPLVLCEFTPYSSHSYIKTNDNNRDNASTTEDDITISSQATGAKDLQHHHQKEDKDDKEEESSKNTETV